MVKFKGVIFTAPFTTICRMCGLSKDIAAICDTYLCLHCFTGADKKHLKECDVCKKFVSVGDISEKQCLWVCGIHYEMWRSMNGG